MKLLHPELPAVHELNLFSRPNETGVKHSLLDGAVFYTALLRTPPASMAVYETVQ